MVPYTKSLANPNVGPNVVNKYALVIIKNLSLGYNSGSCSAGYFLISNQSFAVILNLDTIFMTLPPIFLKKLQLVLRPLFKMPLGAHSTQLSEQMDCSCAFHFDQYFMKNSEKYTY